MDYTSLDEVHTAMQGDDTITVQDSILSKYITKASRLMDMLATGVYDYSSQDYFTKADVTNEYLTNGVISNGALTIYPHKAVINSVASLSYKYRLKDAYTIADTASISPEVDSVYYEGWIPYQERVYVQISYNGGFASDEADLPPAFIDLATMIAVRLYKEARGNYTDAIGIAELGTMIYTKSFPARFLETLPMYQRTVPWM